MKTKIAAATVVDHSHPRHGQICDLWIENGRITAIEEPGNREDADRVLKADGLCVSKGWMDMRANFRDPGHEWKEDLSSGLAAAKRGGFTRVALSPDTSPPMDQKGAVEYAVNKARGSGVELVPIGALSKGLQGKELAEMFDMSRAGAKGFGDDKRSLTETGLLMRALLYTQPFGAVVFHFPHDPTLVRGAQVNEGHRSILMGMKGIPAIAEEMVVQRDLNVLRHVGGRLHLGPLSSAASVRLVARAKEDGLDVTCEVAAAHLVYDEDDLDGFDARFKLMPPLRSDANWRELVRALKEGAIDVVSSDHQPEDEESKKREFEQAAFGTAGIETFFPLLYDRLGEEVALERLIETFSEAPRRILGLEMPKIEVGASADLTVFSTSNSTEVEKGRMKSKAYNVAEWGRRLKGAVVDTFVGG